MHEIPSNLGVEKPEVEATGAQPGLTVTQSAAISYAGIGFAFGIGAAVITFIGA